MRRENRSCSSSCRRSPPRGRRGKTLATRAPRRFPTRSRTDSPGSSLDAVLVRGTIDRMQLLYETRPSAICTVSDLSRQIKDLLEGAFPSITVLGEISNLVRPPSGHVY